MGINGQVKAACAANVSRPSESLEMHLDERIFIQKRGVKMCTRLARTIFVIVAVLLVVLATICASGIVLQTTRTDVVAIIVVMIAGALAGIHVLFSGNPRGVAWVTLSGIAVAAFFSHSIQRDSALSPIIIILPLLSCWAVIFTATKMKLVRT